MNREPDIPEERFEPEIERRLTIPKIEIPEFKPFIKEADIADFTKRDQKMLLSMSKFEQMLDHLLRWQQIANGQMRSMQAEMIRRNGWLWVVTKWIGITVGAGVISKLLDLWIRHK